MLVQGKWYYNSLACLVPITRKESFIKFMNIIEVCQVGFLGPAIKVSTYSERLEYSSYDIALHTT
jgi:hypothetical protein